MSRRSRLFAAWVISLVSANLMIVFSGESSAAEKAKIQDAISRAQKFLLTQQLGGPAGAFASLALIKSGIDKQSPSIQLSVLDIPKKIEAGVYRPRQHYVYEAGVDLMLLEAVDREFYKPQMESIVSFLVNSQLPNGSWYYERGDSNSSDTSITQYAVLGLWAAERAGIDVPVATWEKAARWHINTQQPDNGYAYHVHEIVSENDPKRLRSSDNMTAAGTSSMLIIRRILFNNIDHDAEVRPVDAKRRFGVLERFVDEKVKKENSAPKETSLKAGDLDKSIKESMRWVSQHFGERSPVIEANFAYFFYCIERVAALTDVEKIGQHDWYDAGADELLRRQSKDGSWTDGCGTVPTTGLALLFLSKATTTIVTPKKKIALHGGGLQIGGRGLPKNLGAVDVKDGNVSSRKIVGPVDDVLIALEQAVDAKVEDANVAVVEAVKIERREDLIVQLDKARKLARDSRTELRQVAMWALGRSGDITVAPLLIAGLEDSDFAVAREASLALCFLSRRPEGCGVPIDPQDDSQMGLDENSSDEVRKSRMEAWTSDSKRRWHEWYLKIRPYEERDDSTSLRKSNK